MSVEVGVGLLAELMKSKAIESKTAISDLNSLIEDQEEDLKKRGNRVVAETEPEPGEDTGSPIPTVPPAGNTGPLKGGLIPT